MHEFLRKRTLSPEQDHACALLRSRRAFCVHGLARTQVSACAIRCRMLPCTRVSCIAVLRPVPLPANASTHHGASAVRVQPARWPLVSHITCAENGRNGSEGRAACQELGSLCDACSDEKRGSSSNVHHSGMCVVPRARTYSERSSQYSVDRRAFHALFFVVLLFKCGASLRSVYVQRLDCRFALRITTNVFSHTPEQEHGEPVATCFCVRTVVWQRTERHQRLGRHASISGIHIERK